MLMQTGSPGQELLNRGQRESFLSLWLPALGIEQIGRQLAVAIVRSPKADPSRCVAHFFPHGIRLVEVTMDTPFAVEIIRSSS
jgi:hypothetical protein